MLVHDSRDPPAASIRSGVDWREFERTLSSLNERPSRFSYDGQTLQIETTISLEREQLAAAIGQLVREIATLHKLPRKSGASTTLKKELVRKGLEPDQCFWFENASLIRGVRELDLTMHPAPDLVIEVDITHSAVNREAIYAALGVAEMWRYRQGRLDAFVLDEHQSWKATELSRSLPMLRVSDLLPWAERLVNADDETPIVLEFRAWAMSLV